MRIFRMLPGLVAGLMMVSTANQADAALIGTSVSTGIAALKEWNLIAFNNLTSSNHVDGRVFVGNNFNDNGDMGINLKGATSSYGTASVTVGGDLSRSNGGFANINGSGVTVGGNVTTQLDRNGGGNLLVGGNLVKQEHGADTAYGNQNDTVKDFTQTILNQSSDLKASLTSLSANLKALADTGTKTTYDGNNFVITASNAGLNVITLSAFDLSNIKSSLDVKNPNGGTTVINVTGTDMSGLQNININMTDAFKNVIWNFVDAKTIDLSRQFSGSILAVNATVNRNSGGNIDGTVVAYNVNQYAGEIHNTYQGDLSSVGSVSAAPEPATWAMLIVGFGLVGFSMRRRRPAAATLAHA